MIKKLGLYIGFLFSFLQATDWVSCKNMSAKDINQLAVPCCDEKGQCFNVSEATLNAFSKNWGSGMLYRTLKKDRPECPIAPIQDSIIGIKKMTGSRSSGGIVANSIWVLITVTNAEFVCDLGDSTIECLDTDKLLEFTARKQKPKVISQSKWTFKACSYINQGEVFIGMTTEQARASWGYPGDINYTKTEKIKSEQWVYSGKGYLYFKEGLLTAIQY